MTVTKVFILRRVLHGPHLLNSGVTSINKTMIKEAEEMVGKGSCEIIIPKIAYCEIKHALEWLSSHRAFWSREICFGQDKLLVRTPPSRTLWQLGFAVSSDQSFYLIESSLLAKAIDLASEEVFWLLGVLQFVAHGGRITVKSGFFFDEDGYGWSVFAFGSSEYLKKFNERLLREYECKDAVYGQLTDESLEAVYKELGYPIYESNAMFNEGNLETVFGQLGGTVCKDEPTFNENSPPNTGNVSNE